MTFQERFKKEDLCHRCGVEFGSHPNPAKFSRECDNPRYLRNRDRKCRCDKTSLINTSLRQKEERDPNWSINTHCCFCKKATKIFHLRTKKINGEEFEQCYNCKDKTQVPRMEEPTINKLKGRRERNESDQERKRTRLTPEREVVNNYADGPVWKPIKNKEEPSWQKEEQKNKGQWCTERCQFMDHKQLSKGRITYFDADTRMVHDDVNCPLGALDYNYEGRSQPRCLCFNRKAKYCQQHQHETEKCNCPIESRIVERNFGGSRCPALNCPYEGEYQHCSHNYCRKHRVYIMGYKQPCKECQEEVTLETKEEDYESEIKNQEEEIKRTLGIGSSTQEKKTTEEDPMEFTIDLETDEEKENKKLREQIKQLHEEQQKIKEDSDHLKELNKKLQEELRIKNNENQILIQDLKEASVKIETLAKEIEKVELVEKSVCSKEVSIFHCKDCKEEGNDYIYCPQSIINMYKALYFSEEAIRKEKEEEIKEYQGLFETYQKQEEERNEEPTFDEEVFNQILAELDITYNPEKVELNEQ
ncbi:hypothetical protein Glove_400g1 [Diversispora epigaea]|uniref:Uncharacterized protein n=1 Tax=Diversispora epigaea TaxID=1348612 RepID=A0A397H822_9GLOM|nr:hypothetical protein Glove_400g1 [Diversispora epigaea]